MKKMFSLVLLSLKYTLAYTQSIGFLTDAIRVSDNYYLGSARSSSMANAFGALGADFGSIPINPAGIAVYQASEFSLTPGFLSLNNDASYYNQQTNDHKFKFNFSSIGTILSIKSKDDNWKTINLSFGYNKVNNLNSLYNIRGITINTLMNEFIRYSKDRHFDELDSYFEAIAFNLAIIDTIPGNPTNYFSPYQEIPILQQRNINTKGSIGEYSFGIGANYNHKLYLGLTVNVRSGYYDDIYNHKETDIDDLISDNYYVFDYQLSTMVSGWNAKIGVIFRPIEPLRLGIALHTPTLYDINQKMTTKMKVVEDNGNTTFEYPRTTNGNLLGKLEDNYTIISPFRTIISAGYIFGSIGLISIDYERINYTYAKITYNEASDIATYTNEQIKDRLTSVSNIRIGSELKLNTLYLRAGYGFYQSPYKKNELNEKANTSIMSGGLGYRSNKFFIDLGYSYTLRNEKYYLYDDDNLQPATLNYRSSNYLLTIGLRF